MRGTIVFDKHECAQCTHRHVRAREHTHKEYQFVYLYIIIDQCYFINCWRFQLFPAIHFYRTITTITTIMTNTQIACKIEFINANSRNHWINPKQHNTIYNIIPFKANSHTNTYILVRSNLGVNGSTMAFQQFYVH